MNENKDTEKWDFKCKYCGKEFTESMDGIIELTLHELSNHGIQVTE